MKACKVDGCKLRCLAREFCSGHYKRYMKFGDPLACRQLKERKCTVQECKRKHFGLGLCSAHYQQQKYLGFIKPEEIRPTKARIGDLYVQKNGYVFMVVLPETPGSKRPQSGERRWVMLHHRFVMQEHIGRHLLPDEDVHHINGNRGDNRIENLEIWTRSHPRGQRSSDLVVWAKQILERYDTEKPPILRLVHGGRVA